LGALSTNIHEHIPKSGGRGPMRGNLGAKTRPGNKAVLPASLGRGWQEGVGQ